VSRATAEADPAGDEKEVIAALDRQYQETVKLNDGAAMDRILADEFILVTSSGKVYTKSDLLNEARSARTLLKIILLAIGVKNMRLLCNASTALTRSRPASDFKTKPRAPASKASRMTCSESVIVRIITFCCGLYAVSEWANERGYGSPDEIVLLGEERHKAS
jgi:uncharacterized membrane protein YiaA